MKQRNSKLSSKSQSGFGILEITIGLILVGGLSVLISTLLKFQSQQKEVAELKASMNTLLVNAQSATKKFEFSYLNAFLSDPAQDEIQDCFKGRGTDCDIKTLGTLAFPVSDPGAATMNAMLRGMFDIKGKPCTGTNCPLELTSDWTLVCVENSCSGIQFNNRVSINTTGVNRKDILALARSVQSVEAQYSYSNAKSVGLVRTIASTCTSATGVNFVSGAVACSPNPTANSANKLFDLDLGFNAQNSNIRLLAGTLSGAPLGTEVQECPPGKISRMEGDTLVCEDEPTILCSQQGWIVKNEACCNPSIPDDPMTSADGEGDGWGAWSACTATCDSRTGTQTRSCLYSKSTYCDSQCSTGETQSRSCSANPIAGNDGWGAWGSCSKACGGGTQTRSCVQPRSDFCGSSCNMGDTSSRSCNTQACTCSNGALNYPACNNCGNGCFKMRGGRKVCRPQRTENDNGGGGRFSSDNQTKTFDYSMGDWDQTEYAGGSFNRCRASKTSDGGEMVQDRVRVTCKGDKKQSYSFQLRRKTCD